MHVEGPLLEKKMCRMFSAVFWKEPVDLRDPGTYYVHQLQDYAKGEISQNQLGDAFLSASESV